MGITDILGGSIGDIVAKIVGTFKLSPQAKAELEQQLNDHKFELDKLTMDMEQKLQDTASQNIQAETKSSDKYTSRARPTFLYIMEFILLWNYVMVPLFKESPVALPEPIFWLFGSCVLGYTGARSWEKISGIKQS